MGILQGKRGDVCLKIEPASDTYSFVSRELDSYILGDTKTAQHKLNNDLDDYFAAKKDKKAETATEAAAEAPKEATA